MLKVLVKIGLVSIFVVGFSGCDSQKNLYGTYEGDHSKRADITVSLTLEEGSKCSGYQKVSSKKYAFGSSDCSWNYENKTVTILGDSSLFRIAGNTLILGNPGTNKIDESDCLKLIKR